MALSLECPGGVESQQIPDLILSNSQNLSQISSKVLASPKDNSDKIDPLQLQ